MSRKSRKTRRKEGQFVRTYRRDHFIIRLKAGRIAEAYAIPATITNVDAQRHRSKIGSQVLLGSYLCGMVPAQDLISKLPPRSRRRYHERARELSRRKRGRPVHTTAK